MSDPTTRLGSAIADRYRLERQLGAGGMATVYLAHDLRHQRRVALKVLRPELAAVLGAERFLSEIRVTAGLQHPHILPLHDSGEAGEFLYYVMPWVDGETLRERLSRERQLPVEDAIAVARAVLGAVDYAHRHGVIHRDIKPENILLHDGQPLLADFGIALAVTAAGGTRLTATGLSLGTPQYMSPEQAVGDGEVDERTDVYSLGAVLYEMLAGEPPHSGRTAQAVVAKVLTDKPARLTLLRETVPPHLAAAVHKALAKIPADRFRSAAEFAAALARAPEAAAAPAQPSPAAASHLDWRSRLAGPLAVLALALGGLALWGWLRPEPAAPVRRFRLAIPAQVNLSRSLVPDFSPDGSLLAFVAGAADGSGAPQLYLLRRDQLDATPVPGTEGGVLPFFSPDGRRLAYFQTRTGSLRVVGLAGEPPVTLLADGVAGRGGAWGSDGYIYVMSGVGGLARVSETGGPLEPVTALKADSGELAHTGPVALPNGKGVLFKIVRRGASTSADAELSDIAVVDLESRRVSVLVRGVAVRYAPTGHVVYATTDGGLFAAPLDESRLKLSGPPVAVAGGLNTRAGFTEFALSSTGSLLYVAGVTPADPDEVVWVDRDGTVTPLDSGWVGDFHAPALSPDGRRLAVAVGAPGQQQIWVKPVGRGPALRLTFEGQQNNRPAWSPDGRTVVFESDREGSPDLYVKPADGSAPEIRVLDRDRPLHGAQWSHDGRWLVAREGGGPGGPDSDPGRRDIIAFRPGMDSAAIPVVATAADEWAPALSPDSRYLAYVSDESGRQEVYVRPFPDAGRAKWQVSVDGGAEPVWAHGGRELFYRSSGSLMVVDLAAGPGFAVAERRVLVPLDWTFWPAPGHRNYDVSPDDRRFVMIKRRPDEGLEIILVENWFAELEAKARR